MAKRKVVDGEHEFEWALYEWECVKCGCVRRVEQLYRDPVPMVRYYVMGEAVTGCPPCEPRGGDRGEA